MDKIQETISQMHTAGLLNTLRFIVKGGRLRESIFKVETILSVKPLITLRDGEIKPLGLARNWNKGDIDPRLKNPPSVVVAFTILKNGTVPANSVRVIQRSGNTALDYSAMRAIYDSSPFPALPAGFERNEALIEFEFELRR